MKDDFSEKWYTLKDLNRAFNMGLESAVLVLESAEKLHPGGRRFLVELLKKQITRGPCPEDSPALGHKPRRTKAPPARTSSEHRDSND